MLMQVIIHHKKEAEAKEFIKIAEAQWHGSSSSPILLEHFFSQWCQPQDSADTPKPLGDSDAGPCWVLISDSDSNSEASAQL